MVEYIPQGGNWQALPEDFPSKRIQQIREMSKTRGVVRTSYYGRLRPEQPAYTISTYYNRPGNGTNIHPWENRTITSREAARLQSFPDYYVFLGSETAIRNQVGNAVPPLLACQVALAVCHSLIKELTAVDVFCGAGGLSLGFREAGFEIVGAIDNNRDAIDTHAENQNDTPVTCGDLSNSLDFSSFLESTIKNLNGRKLGALIGGPPCQGFSTAGWRHDGDRRNDMIWHYFKLLQKLDPEVFVIENVEGILSMKGGEIVRQIQNSGAELGYSVQAPWVLRAEQYGVPQMRKRVFIVGSKPGVPAPTRPQPIFTICKGRRESPEDRSVTNYPITVSEAFEGLQALGLQAIKSDRTEFERTFYGEYCSGMLSAKEFFCEIQSHIKKQSRR